MSEATLISDGAPAGDAAGSQAAASAAAAAPAAAAAAAAPAASAQADQGAPAAGDTPAGTAGAAGADGGDKPAGDKPAAEGAEGEQATGAPEAYADFTIPEGVTLDETMVGDLKTIAKELNLPQAAAQKLVDLGVKQAQAIQGTLPATINEANTATVTKAKADWAQQTQADPDIGGDKLTASVASAKKALTTFGTPALKELLDQTGLGNHPEIIRAFAKAGAAISEDTLLPPGGNGGGGVDTSSLAGKAQKLYPDQN